MDSYFKGNLLFLRPNEEVQISKDFGLFGEMTFFMVSYKPNLRGNLTPGLLTLKVVSGENEETIEERQEKIHYQSSNENYQKITGFHLKTLLIMRTSEEEDCIHILILSSSNLK
jgi:hypothetical protein